MMVLFGTGGPFFILAQLRVCWLVSNALFLLDTVHIQVLTEDSLA